MLGNTRLDNPIEASSQGKDAYDGGQSWASSHCKQGVTPDKIYAHAIEGGYPALNEQVEELFELDNPFPGINPMLYTDHPTALGVRA